MLTGVQTRALCALLNSTLARWYIRKTAPTSGMGTPRWKKIYVESIPLATTNKVLRILSKLVDEARECIDECSLAQIDDQVDSLVFWAYGLSVKEANVIKASTSF